MKIFFIITLLMTSIAFASDLDVNKVDIEGMRKVLPEKWYVSSIHVTRSPSGWEKRKSGDGLTIKIKRIPYSYKLNRSKGGGLRVHTPTFRFCIMPEDFSGESANGATFTHGELKRGEPASEKAMLILDEVKRIQVYLFFYTDTYFEDWENPSNIFNAVMKSQKEP